MKPLTYKSAGVDLENGQKFIQEIKPHIDKTKRDGMVGGFGGFGGMFRIPKGYKNPILVSGTDGVGTKLKLAIEFGEYYTSGIDAVAMCVNDVITSGAEPLFFLDYYASDKLDIEKGAEVIRGVAEGCKQSNCVLIGGETAEMPGIYNKGDYDLAGFCVGVVEENKIVGTSRKYPIKTEDAVIGLSSSGPHSNGFSLIRKIIDVSGVDLEKGLREDNTDLPLAQKLLAPTTIYVKTILNLIKAFPDGQIKGIANITGGGLVENIPRILPETYCVDINTDSWGWPPVFKWLQQAGNVPSEEMYKVFNCGVGMVIVVDNQHQHEIIDFLKSTNTLCWKIGSISRHSKENIRFTKQQ